ncbi:methyltransferase [Thermodesulfobacteriota bacterium]
MKSETTAYGLTLLQGNHKKILELKKKYKPTDHGHKVWPNSWLMIGYLEKTRTVSGKRVIDLGCGWGLNGIYCAKKQDASVTCVDVDKDVKPFVNLMAEINQVEIRFVNLGIDQVKRSLLKNVDIIIASDICFCDSLIDPIRRLIQRAKKAEVKQFLISDPGRWPFEDLCDMLLGKKGVELILWEVQRPAKIEGKILRVDL